LCEGETRQQEQSGDRREPSEPMERVHPNESFREPIGLRGISRVTLAEKWVGRKMTLVDLSADRCGRMRVVRCEAMRDMARPARRQQIPSGDDKKKSKGARALPPIPESELSGDPPDHARYPTLPDFVGRGWGTRGSGLLWAECLRMRQERGKSFRAD
jgi:hypothetical protein